MVFQRWTDVEGRLAVGIAIVLVIAAASISLAGLGRTKLRTPPPLTRAVSAAACADADLEEPGDAPVMDPAAVEAVFNAYRDAVTRRDGATAASLVSDRTICYYDRLRNAALVENTQQILQRPLIERFVIARTRVLVNLNTLEGLSPINYFRVAVAVGVISEDPASRLGPARISPDRVVTGNAVDRGSSQPTRVFLAEGGAWRLDLPAQIPAFEESLARAAFRAGLDGDAFIFKSLSELLGRPVDASVYRRPV